MNKIIPILEALKGYGKITFASDAIAGITVGVVLIPQAIAYALLMGTPPIYGLYACLIPLIIYAFFGTSRQLSIGPVAVTAILVMSGVSQLATPFTEEFTNLVIFSGLLIGILQIVLSLLRMGFLVNLISQPVISGFISAAAIIIIVSQLSESLGIKIPNFDYPHESIWYAIKNISSIHVITLSMCLGSIVVMLILKKIKKSFPGALFVLIITTVITIIFDLKKLGLSVIEDVPKGLPSFSIPDMSYDSMIALIPSVLTVTFIGYVGSIGIAKSLEIKNRDHIVRPNQELLALGLAKVVGAFFQAIPSSGSYSRSAINDEAGGKTTISSIITVIMVIISLLFLTSFFYYIPNAVLAAIILVSVFGLINISEARYLLALRRREFIVMFITFIGTLVFGVEKGIFIGVILSYIFLQYYSSRPHVAELVNIPNTNYYRNIKRFPDATRSSRYLIIRFDDQLYFANTSYFKDAILNQIDKREVLPEFLILDSTNINDIDSTGLHILEDVHRYLEDLGVQLLITGTIGPVRDFLKRSGFTDNLGSQHNFLNIEDAVNYTDNKTVQQNSLEVAVQYNKKRSFLD
ncbi:SulP family inorganic anion transporter [Aquimarina sp. MMG015]|uniref:SulP family inorganic anion transporter n=1 Tax=Aquimarina sp. MMG015 TaxID=2822689 RepID=UPI001FFC2FFB|nr:sulfate permease [Aquimarina sp. MMG015]